MANGVTVSLLDLFSFEPVMLFTSVLLGEGFMLLGLPTVLGFFVACARCSCCSRAAAGTAAAIFSGALFVASESLDRLSRGLDTAGKALGAPRTTG